MQLTLSAAGNLPLGAARRLTQAGPGPRNPASQAPPRPAPALPRPPLPPLLPQVDLTKVPQHAPDELPPNTAQVELQVGDPPAVGSQITIGSRSSSGLLHSWVHKHTQRSNLEVCSVLHCSLMTLWPAGRGPGRPGHGGAAGCVHECAG